MSTDAILYAHTTLTLGVDGNVTANKLASDGCCSDPVCSNEKELACSYVDLLPSGPLWDEDKARAREVIHTQGLPNGTTIKLDQSMAAYAVYVARGLHYAIETSLAPVVREADPATAVDTVDDWLKRFGWVDCYRSFCRDQYMALFSPYETKDACGASAYCATSFSADYEAALKHAILKSLKRLQRGVVPNLDGINWVIAPLGAKVEPVYTAAVQDEVTNTPANGYRTDANCGPQCWCDVVKFKMTATSTTIPRAPTAAHFCAPTVADPGTLPAMQSYDCTTDTAPAVNLNPGVITAECIVRSMLSSRCPIIITR